MNSTIQKLHNYIYDNTAYSRKPDHVIITKESDKIQAKVRWLQYDDIQTMGSKETIKKPSVETVQINNKELHEIFKQKFQRYNIQLNTYNANSIELKQPLLLTNQSYPNIHVEPEWNDKITTSFKFRQTITLHTKIQDKDKKLIENIVDHVNKNEDVQTTKENYEQITIKFHDETQCQIENIQLKLHVKEPQKFVNGISSKQEYCKHHADSKEEYKKLIKQSTYEIYYQIQTKEINNNIIKKTPIEICNNNMNNYVIKSDKHIIEANHINYSTNKKIIDFNIITPVSGL